MRNRMYGGVRGRKTKVGEKLLRFPPTRFVVIFLSFNTQYLTFSTEHSPLNYPNTTLAGTPRLWYMFLATSKLIARRPWRISLNAVVDTPIAFAASFCL